MSESSVEPSGAPAGAKYYSVTDPGDAEPWAVVRVQPRGLYEMWTGEAEGWVDMPFFASYFVGGEPGAAEVSEAEAEELKGSVKAPSPGAVAMLRGSQGGEAEGQAAESGEAEEQVAESEEPQE